MFVRLFMRPKCDHRNRERSRLNFKHVQNSDATRSDQKITCNDCDQSRDESDRSYDVNKAGSLSVLKRSCANCESPLTSGGVHLHAITLVQSSSEENLPRRRAVGDTVFNLTGWELNLKNPRAESDEFNQCIDWVGLA